MGLLDWFLGRSSKVVEEEPIEVDDTPPNDEVDNSTKDFISLGFHTPYPQPEDLPTHEGQLYEAALPLCKTLFPHLKKRGWTLLFAWRLISSYIYLQNPPNADNILDISKDPAQILSILTKWRVAIHLILLETEKPNFKFGSCWKRFQEIMDEALLQGWDFTLLLRGWERVRSDEVMCELQTERDRVEILREEFHLRSPRRRLLEMIPELQEYFDAGEGETDSETESDDGSIEIFVDVIGEGDIFKEENFEDFARRYEQIEEQDSDSGDDPGTDLCYETSTTSRTTPDPDVPPSRTFSTSSSSRVTSPRTPSWRTSTPEPLASPVPSFTGALYSPSRTFSPHVPSAPSSPFIPTPPLTKPALMTSRTHKKPTYREPRIAKVDPLRYVNKLAIPRRLPNTPTKSHLPPSPRRTGVKERFCGECGREFRKARKSGGAKVGRARKVREEIEPTIRKSSRVRKATVKFE